MVGKHPQGERGNGSGESVKGGGGMDEARFCMYI